MAGAERTPRAKFSSPVTGFRGAVDNDRVLLVGITRESERTRLHIPSWEKGRFIISPPPGSVPGTWIGAPRAAVWEEEKKMLMVVRLRQPEGMGRGGALVLLESSNGNQFNTDKPLQVLTKEDIYDPRLDDEIPASLELASLVRAPSGKWRLYISLAEDVEGRRKQWHIRMIEASAPNEFDPSKQIPILSGNTERAVKDPSVKYVNGKWILAAACHINPISDPQNADRMYAGVSVSDDGISFPEPRNEFGGVPGTPYERGFRITEFAVNPQTHRIEEAFGDGRPDARHNWFEHTFHLKRDSNTGLLVATSPEPVLASPNPAYTPDGELLADIDMAAARYLCIVPWPEKGKEFTFYEATGKGGINGIRAEEYELIA